MGETLLRYREDAVTGAPVLSLEDFLASDPMSNGAAAVRITPGEDARALLPHLGRIALIEVTFPAYTDGRGYSSARILREQGYTGELRASGDVLIDQLVQMQRSGFDSAVLRADQDAAAAEVQFSRFASFYQGDARTIAPLFAR